MHELLYTEIVESYSTCLGFICAIFFIPPYNVQFVECACAPSSGVLRPECHIVPTPTSASSPGSATCRGCVRLGSRYTFGAGILVHYIWSWYSCSLYLELVFLFFIFGAGILVHYIWSWYSCSFLVLQKCPSLRWAEAPPELQYLVPNK